MSNSSELELIGVDEPTVDESTVMRGGVPPRNLAVLGVLTLLSLFALRAISDPKPIESAEQEADSTSQQITDDEIIDREASGENTSDDQKTPPTTRDTNRTTTTRPSDPSRIVEGEPVFDDETGWDILIGGETNMKLLKVDGGPTVQFETRGAPAGVVGDFIVFGGPPNGAIRYARLEAIDEESQPAVADDRYGWWGEGLIHGDGDAQFWSRSGDFENPKWRLVDLAGSEAETVREVAIATNGANLHPLIRSAPSGGLFVGTEDDLQRVADGNLLAVSEEYVIVEQCNTPFDCPMAWLDRETFEPRTDILAPPSGDGIDYWGPKVSPDGTYALLLARNGENLMWNLKTGEKAVESSFSGEAFAFSPDSHFAAGMNRNSWLEIIDLRTGEARKWSTVSSTSGFITMVFVPAGMATAAR